jgi:hypothetical protein
MSDTAATAQTVQTRDRSVLRALFAVGLRIQVRLSRRRDNSGLPTSRRATDRNAARPAHPCLRSVRPESAPDHTALRSIRRCAPVTRPGRPVAENAGTPRSSLGPSAIAHHLAGGRLFVPAAVRVEYSLLSRCLWCREPIGWLTDTRIWVHLPSDHFPCRAVAGGWATADPDVTVALPNKAGAARRNPSRID